MQSDIQTAKASLRKQIRSALRRIPLERWKSDSEKLSDRLKRQSFFQSAKSVLFFASLPEEPDLWSTLEEALAQRKIVALPGFDADSGRYLPRRVTNLHGELAPGRFGIREPVADCLELAATDLNLVLVPGAAFDLHGHRLGRGHGFYDRLLAEFNGIKTGIAFDEQIVDAIPAERHDVPMNFILTPTRCVKCNYRR